VTARAARLARVTAAAVAATLVLAGCATTGTRARPSGSASPPASLPAGSGSASASPPAGLAGTIARYGATTLAWSDCGDGFQCAKLTVPLDYAKPRGDTIKIALIRLPARKRAARIGSVVLNPGGPGGSGIDFARQATALLPAEILERFDTVSFDPRGVGESAPVDCYDDAQLDKVLGADPTPDTPAEHEQLFALSKDEAQACERRSAKLLPHVGTVDTAKDLDVLRAALRDDKLTYVGFSYGTLLGARYAEQFPTHIRALVLDGALDPTLTARAQTLAQAVGFDKALDAFLADCAAQHCAFASHGDPHRTYDALMASIDRDPLPSSHDPSRRVGPSEALFGVAAGLYSREFGWPVLRTALEQAYAHHDGAQLLALFDNLVERDDHGHYSNSVEAQAAVNCIDAPYARSVAAYDADAKAFAKQAPRFGPALAYGPAVCAYWPVPAVSQPGPIHAVGAPPIVVVGTTRDPATPYQWAQALAAQLPGVLVTHVGDGHTAYGYHRSACVEDVVDAYLISLTVPKPGTRC
jgi:pimeloyl-ACP methyl ester carboxylesterase